MNTNLSIEEAAQRIADAIETNIPEAQKVGGSLRLIGELLADDPRLFDVYRYNPLSAQVIILARIKARA